MSYSKPIVAFPLYIHVALIGKGKQGFVNFTVR